MGELVECVLLWLSGVASSVGDIEPLFQFRRDQLSQWEKKPEIWKGKKNERERERDRETERENKKKKKFLKKANNNKTENSERKKNEREKERERGEK